MKLSVEIDGQMVALSDAVWVQSRPCGCPCSVMDADWGDGEVFASEDQAWHELHPLKRDRERFMRQGYTIRIVTFRHYREHIDLRQTCDTCKPKPKGAAA